MRRVEFSLVKKIPIRAIGVNIHVLLGKILSRNPLSKNIVTVVLNKEWKTMGSWTITVVKPGIFKLQFELRKDRDAILEKCIWTIKGVQFLHKLWPENLTIKEVRVQSCPFWVKLDGLSP